jgi:hypothetical protein
VTGPADAVADVLVLPLRGDGPAQARFRPQPWVVTWIGGEADVLLRTASGEQALALHATPPVSLASLAPGATVVVRSAAGEGAAVAWPLWSPADVAAWSGPGLRGRSIADLAFHDGELWVATRGGGLGRWDGTAWRHADRRSGLPSERGAAVAIDGEARWWGDAIGALRFTPEASTAWALPGGVRGVALLPDGSALASTGDGVVRLHGDVASRLTAVGCADVLPDPAGGWLVPCAEATWHLPSAAADAEVGPGLVGAVPRAGGRYLAYPGGVDIALDGARSAWWTAPPGVAVTGLAVLDGALLALTDPGPAWLLSEDGAASLRAVDGVPGRAGQAVAPGPAPGKLWLGTDAGVALVNADGVGTPLPLAPLPAGDPVAGLQPWKRSLGVAGPTGLVWIGPGAPRGFDQLAAAVGPAPRDVLRDAHGGWWAAAGSAAWRLHRGELTRLDLDAPVRQLVRAGERVAFATDDGVRLWIPGATMPSPALPLRTTGPIRAGDDGALWLAVEGGVARYHGVSTRTWALPNPALALVPVDRQCVALTAAGPVRLTPEVDDPQPVAELPPDARDAAAVGRTVGVVDSAGELWVFGPGEPTRLALDGAAALGVEADAHGLWIRTDIGLARLVLPAARRR